MFLQNFGRIQRIVLTRRNRDFGDRASKPTSSVKLVNRCFNGSEIHTLTRTSSELWHEQRSKSFSRPSFRSFFARSLAHEETAVSSSSDLVVEVGISIPAMSSSTR